MKIRVWITIGLIGCKQQTEIDVPDDELEGLSEGEQNEVLENYARDFKDEKVDWGWDRKE